MMIFFNGGVDFSDPTRIFTLTFPLLMFTKVVESSRMDVNMVSRACLKGCRNENNVGKGKIFIPYREEHMEHTTCYFT